MHEYSSTDAIFELYTSRKKSEQYLNYENVFNNFLQEFTLTDDTVLEEHFEDPRLTQMKLLGEGGKHKKSPLTNFAFIFIRFRTVE